jgi:O-antigen/teichoic acid export membrane protein
MTDASRHAGSEQQEGRGKPSWVMAWLSDSSMMLVAQILTVLATSIAAILVARTLAPADWGVFSAFLGLSLALAIVVDFGLATWLLREFSRIAASGSPGARTVVGETLSGAATINVSMGLILLLGGAVWAAVDQLRLEATVALLSLLAYGALSAAASALEAYLRSRREVRLVVGVSIVEKFLLLVMLAVVALAGGGLAGMGAAYVIAGLARVSFDGVLIFVRRDVPLFRPRLASVRAIGRSSAPFALTTASLNVVPRLDTLVVLTVSATSAAWFAIGDRILGPALLIPATLGSTLYPFLATTSGRKTAPWKLAVAMGTAGLAAALVGIVLAPVVIPLLFGAEYDEAVPVAQVMLLVLPLIYATSPLLASAYSSGAERTLVIPALVLSLIGSCAIIVGGLVAGARGAGAGILVRSMLFLLFIGFVAHSQHAARHADARSLSAEPPSA